MSRARVRLSADQRCRALLTSAKIRKMSADPWGILLRFNWLGSELRKEGAICVVILRTLSLLEKCRWPTRLEGVCGANLVAISRSSAFSRLGAGPPAWRWRLYAANFHSGQRPQARADLAQAVALCLSARSTVETNGANSAE